MPEPIPLTGGDCFLLARGTSIVLRDSPRTPPTRSFREIGASANGNVVHYGGGGAPTTIVCGSLSFDRASLTPITQLLPSFILVKADQARTLALHITLQALASEMAEQAPGSEMVATRLAEVLIIQVLRAHIALGTGMQQRMASCSLRSSNRHRSECHSRQSRHTLDGRISGRSSGHVSLRIRSTFQRATRTNTVGICYRVADAEGECSYSNGATKSSSTWLGRLAMSPMPHLVRHSSGLSDRILASTSNVI